MEYKPRKIRGGRKSNLEHFSFLRHVQNLHGIWIIQKIPGKADLTKLWSDRLIASLIAHAPELHFQQEVLQGDLKWFKFDLGDMHTRTPKTKEDIEFQRWLIVKLNHGKIQSLEIVLYSSVWTIETNTTRP
jgi:hypothetical protein